MQWAERLHPPTASAGSDLQSLFDYSVPEMVGKSLLKLAGSRTDLTLLQTSIESFKNSCKREAITMCCTLYNRAGTEQDKTTNLM